MAKNFPNLKKDGSIQVQETQRSPIKFNPKRDFPKYIIIKLTKIKDRERILKAAKGKKKNHIQRSPSAAFRGFLSRNPEGQERVKLTLKKNLSAKNTVLSKNKLQT